MEPLDEIRTLIARHVRQGPTPTTVAGLVLTASDTATQLGHGIYEPALALVAQGAKRTVLGDKLFEYGAGQYLLVTIDLPISGHISMASAEEPFLGMGLMLKPATIATLLLETASSDRAVAEPSGMGLSHATPDLLEALARLLRLLDRPRDIAVLAPMIEREILWRLLEGEQGALVRQIGLADSRLSQISHAIRWIRQHYAQILRIEDLAGLAAMSPSSFHRHFRAVTAMSPLQYQKQIRLQEARSRLIETSDDVAAIGFGVGYDSPSQFSREYSRLFGAPPAKDAARLRTISSIERSLA